MTVVLEPTAIWLKEACGVEEADQLLSLLEAHPIHPVNLAAAGKLHTSIWQILLMSGRPIEGCPQEPASMSLILAAIRRNSGAPAGLTSASEHAQNASEQ